MDMRIKEELYELFDTEGPIPVSVNAVIFMLSIIIGICGFIFGA